MRFTLNEADQYILLYLSDGKRRKFTEIINYLKSKGFKVTSQYMTSRLNRLIDLKFIFPRPHPTRRNAKTYEITPLFCKMADERAVVVHSPAFRRPVILADATSGIGVDAKTLVEKAVPIIVEKVKEIDRDTLIELLTSYRPPSGK